MLSRILPAANPRRQFRSAVIVSFIALSIAALITVAPAMEPVERIVAIVGEQPILASELSLQMQLLALNQGIRPESEKELKELQEQVLDQMISEQLFLIEARQDTTIAVTDAEIEQALDERIVAISSQYPSEDRFLEELGREGMSFRAFRRRLRPEIENQLYKQKLIQQKLSKISISRQEVLEFYQKYEDSIPEQSETVRLAHILILIEPSQATRDSVQDLAESVRRNASSGADFATLAMTYSSGPTALAGGDLGIISETDVLPEFGRVAFNLEPGDISGVVITENGLHIIKCEEKQGAKGHFRQILFEVKPTTGDTLLAYAIIDSLVNEIEGGADFREIAKAFSSDDDSRKQGGELGWFPLEGLPPEFITAIDSIPAIGGIFGPVLSQYGLHIIKLLDHQESRAITLEEDFDRLKDMARQTKTGEYIEKWVDDIRQRTYVEIRPLE
ncbi:MAG: peptidylprolyl isomerase [Candidatus Zixiibacteriota bacterium]|nr:MAG: peptidylprolyl isomerase [candidate division Zixibacteria bacterium]